MEKQVFNAGDAKLLHEIVEEAAQKATLNALKILRKEEKEREKNKYDRRLRNTELLLKNYRNLKEHSLNATYSDEEIEEEELQDELDLEENEEMYISSIKRTRKRTEIIVKHINNCIEYYTYKCLNSDREEVQRRVQVIKMLYINEKSMSYFEIAEELRKYKYKNRRPCEKSSTSGISSIVFWNRWIEIKVKNNV